MKLYNSRTHRIEPLIPLINKTVTMYVCGITPYDTTHLGHAFTYTFFDVLVRYIRFKGYKLVYTQNVTDVDDDLLKRAKKERKNWKELGNFWTKRFLTDIKVLNIQMPDFFVKATDSLTKIIEIVKKLEHNGFAYEKSGNVYFEIKKFPDYGKLSRLNREQMMKISKERGGNPNDPKKKDPLDFVLWQRSKKNEPSWDSPWGKGRPGWHIECSAMVSQYLGEQIDIHGGGADLIYPHHESEVAQSESATGKRPFVNFWLHSAMLMYKGEKMSKSLGNLVLVKDLLKKYSADAIRWVFLSHHYRKPWEFFEEELEAAEKKLNQLRKKRVKVSKKQKEFFAALDRDMDTPKALEILYESPSQDFLRLLGFHLRGGFAIG